MAAPARKRRRSRVMPMQMAPDEDTHRRRRVFRPAPARRYHSRPPDTQGAAAMTGSPSSRRVRLRVLPVVLAALALGSPAAAQAPPPGTPLRLHGLVEAVEFFGVVAPSGRSGQLTIVRIAPKGTMVKKGDLVIEFDRQVPLREAIDKQAEWKQFEEDIRKKRAEITLQDAVDDTALKIAENDLALARLETTKNDVLPRIDAEKNTLNRH